MDDFMNKLKKYATKAKDGTVKFSRIFAKRTSDAISSTKLSISISEANGKIKDIYTQIGETMYEKYLNDEKTDDEFLTQFQQIDKLMVDIGELYDKKAELKNRKRCKACGALNDEVSEFCSKCGAILESEDYDDYEKDDETDEIIDEEIIITPKSGE